MHISVKNNSFSVWKELVRNFVPTGTKFEIRCWKGENEAFAKKWCDSSSAEGDETVYTGRVSPAFLKTVLKEPLGKHKITELCTISFFMDDYFVYSEDYGTAVHLLNVMPDDADRVKRCGAVDYTVY